MITACPANSKKAQYFYGISGLFHKLFYIVSANKVIQ